MPEADHCPTCLRAGLERSSRVRRPVAASDGYTDPPRPALAERLQHACERDDALTALHASDAGRRELATELDTSRRDMERRVRDRTSELENANTDLKAFSHSVAHDLRAPLRHIEFYLKQVRNQAGGALPPEAVTWLDRIRASTSHMNALIGGLLQLGIAANQELQARTVDLSAVAQAVCVELQREQPERQVELEIQPELRAFGDPALLRSVAARRSPDVRPVSG